MLRVACLAMAMLTPLVPGQKGETERLFEDLQKSAERIQAGDLVGAERLLKEIVRDAPDCATAWHQVAICMKLQNKHLEAGFSVEQALRFKKDYVEAKVLGAEVFVTTDRGKAVKYALEVAETSTDVKHLRTVLEVLVRLRETEKALPVLDKVIAQAPKDAKLLELKARWALAAKKPEIAEQAYAAVVALKPRNPQALENLARVQLHMGKRTRALKTLEETLVVNPSNIRVRETVIELMVALERESKDVEVQRNYLKYYKYWQAKREARERAGKTGTARPGK